MIDTITSKDHFVIQRNTQSAIIIIIIIIIYPLTESVVGAPQIILQPFFSIFSLFSTALLDLPNSRPVRSLMLSSHLFLNLPCLLPSFTSSSWHDKFHFCNLRNRNAAARLADNAAFVYIFLYIDFWKRVLFSVHLMSTALSHSFAASSQTPKHQRHATSQLWHM